VTDSRPVRRVDKVQCIGRKAMIAGRFLENLNDCRARMAASLTARKITHCRFEANRAHQPSVRAIHK